MSWNQLTLDVPDELTDAVVGELCGEHVAGFWEIESRLPGRTRLVAYLPPEADFRSVRNRIQKIFDRSDCGMPAMVFAAVEDRDWNEEWKKSYMSFPIGDDFFVIPSWEQTPCPDDRLPIRIDPGQAFGTGTHETTQLSIQALERWAESSQCVLDLGTGSGILAIAARLLGVRHVFACDIDVDAMLVAQANIARNAEDPVGTFCGSADSIRTGSIHLVLGNLTADLILRLFPEIDRVLKPQGIAVLSGILQEQQEDLREIIRRFHYAVHEETVRGEWVSLVIEKHAA